MEGIDVPNAHARYVDFFKNPSVFTTSIGLATQGLNVDGKGASKGHRCLISMNFLEDAPVIRFNRQLKALNRVLSVSIVAVGILSAALLGFNTVPTFLQTRQASERYDSAKSLAFVQEIRRKSNEKKLSDLSTLNIKVQDAVISTAYSVFLIALPSLVPAEAELEKITINSDGRAEIIGIATSSAAISAIKSNFKREKFSRREPGITTERKDDLWHFKLTADLARPE